MGLLDDAIARTGITEPKSKLGRILKALDAHPKFPPDQRERLRAMLDDPATWPHPRMADIICDVCAELGIDADHLSNKNVGGWRNNKAAR